MNIWKRSVFVAALAVVLFGLAAVGFGCGGGSVGTPPEETADEATPADDTGYAEETLPPAKNAAPAPTTQPKTSSAPPRTTSPRSTGNTGSTTARTEPVAPPAPATIDIPAGAMLEVEFLSELSSGTGQVGDGFYARVVSDYAQDGQLLVPAGATVAGTVTEVQSLKKIGGRAKLGLEFTVLEMPSGETFPIEARFAQEGKSETKKDAATIGGATAGGALLGRVLKKKGDKDKATLIGAVVGAAAGTAIAAKTEGEEVTIPEGTVLLLELASPLTLPASP